ncbi:MAG: peptidoglycan-binding protein [Candidatus Paracaedibacteraceae bacterium]|nr:peptidoglycan-binding protein [Candidatus Paracaedibacteraceae bacterium]
MFTSPRHKRHSVDIWPGFVDALATVLMVIIFVLMTFVVAQLYLTDALSSKEENLSKLQRRVHELTSVLKTEREAKESISQKKATLDQLVADLNTRLAAINKDLASKENALEKKEERHRSILEEVEYLKKQIERLLKSITLYEATTVDDQAKISDLSKKLNQALLERVEELNALNDQMKTLKGENETLSKEVEDNKALTRIGQYRSDFFAKLQKVLGNRNDIRVVGDRFVFQSEVLFSKASAELGVEGQKGLDLLVSALKEISASIPKNLPWILRVDGHTDHLPIKSPQYPSNWELSSARAIAVVKYMISKGIPENHLVAAGFGQHQPLATGADEKELAKNRRIEFKLDQR